MKHTFLGPQHSRLSIPCFLRCSLSIIFHDKCIIHLKMKIIASNTSRHKRGLYFFFTNKSVNRFSKQDYCLCKQKGINGDTDNTFRHTRRWGYAAQNKEAAKSGQTLVLLASSNWTAWEMKKMKQKINIKKSPVQAKDIQQKNLINTEYLHRRTKENKFSLSQHPEATHNSEHWCWVNAKRTKEK